MQPETKLETDDDHEQEQEQGPVSEETSDAEHEHDHDPEDSEAPPNAQESVTSAATSVSIDNNESTTSLTNGTRTEDMSTSTPISNDITAATARFDALVRDRDALREEVTRLRQSLEEVQNNHERQIEELKGELAESREEREGAEERYEDLLGKVNTIRSQLGERLKSDAVSHSPVLRGHEGQSLIEDRKNWHKRARG